MTPIRPDRQTGKVIADMVNLSILFHGSITEYRQALIQKARLRVRVGWGRGVERRRRREGMGNGQGFSLPSRLTRESGGAS